MNTIKKVEEKIIVTLDPEKLITAPAYKREDGSVSKTGLTIGHMISALAMAYVIMKAPHLTRKFKDSTVTFDDGSYVITLS